MTQLDLPPISFARYLDLLKRRRWQVIPVSLFGLLVGGLVAFFVPRYYVAETTLKYSGRVLESDQGTADDPMLGVVAAARLTIPATVPDALRELAWVEALNEDDESARAFTAAVRGRLQVLDLNVDTRGRRFASLKISYRDTRPDRVAAFPNLLRDIWIRDQETRLKDRANQERNRLTQRLAAADQDRSDARQELRIYQEDYVLNPIEGRDGQTMERGRLNDAIRESQRSIAVLEASEQRLAAEAAEYRAHLQDMPRRVPDDTRSNTVLEQEIDKATLDIVVALQALNYTRPAHQAHALRQRQLEQAQARLVELEAQRSAQRQLPENLIDNEKYDDTRRVLLASEAELTGIQGQRERQQDYLDELLESRRRLPVIWQGYEELLDQLERAQKTVFELTEQQLSKTEAYQAINYQQPIEILQRALVPPRPTEPNITLVALGGSAVGLALAIGLILLIDFAQSTFKTVEDVERGLSVPMLGVMAHLETEEQRRRSTANKRRTALVVGAFLVLLVTTVTIYYVDAARLPTFARNLLDLLLGETR